MRGLIEPLGATDFAVATPEAQGRSWWPTSFLAPMAQMEGPVRAGLSAIDAALAELNLPRDRVAILGFSQGACLVLEYAARCGAGLGGVIALSGGLVGTADAAGGGKAFGYDTDLSGLRALVTCHEGDPHIPLERARRSAAVLENLGASAEMIVHPGPGHQPMPEGIAAARSILATL